MRIRPRHSDSAPEVNLIPLIDVLLVIIIFLAISTTFAVDRGIEVNLPQANVQAELPASLELSVTSSGLYAIGGQLLDENTPQALVVELGKHAMEKGSELVLVIRADANASHQSVITAMQAARQAGISKISFAARIPDS